MASIWVIEYQNGPDWLAAWFRGCWEDHDAALVRLDETQKKNPHQPYRLAEYIRKDSQPESGGASE